MSHQAIKIRLDDYVDGLLLGGEQDQIEQHLAGCEDCREEVRFLRWLLVDAAALPRSIAPARDLWPDIADKIGKKPVVSPDFERSNRRSPWFGRGMLAAAAVALIALSSAITTLLVRERSLATGQDSDRPRVPAVLAEVQAFETEYSRAIGELSAVLHERREQLSPETASVIEENLRIIDEAIRTSRAALKADPSNQRSVHTILAMYKKKINLLERAVRLPAES